MEDEEESFVEEVEDIDDVSIEGASDSDLALGPEETEQYWASLPKGVRELVSDAGEVSADLLAFIADDDEQRAQILIENGRPRVELRQMVKSLAALQVNAEVVAARLRRRRVAKRGAQISLEYAVREKLARQKEDQSRLVEGEIPTMSWLVTRSGAHKLPKRKKRFQVTDEEEMERTMHLMEKEKWEKEAKIMIRLLEENQDLPIVAGAKDSQNPTEFLYHVIGSYRSATLRKRTREWKKYLVWLVSTYKVRWPSKRIQVVDYFIKLKETGAPKSVPQAFASTLSFFEKAAGIPEGERLSNDVVYKRALDQVVKEKDEEQPDRKVAPLLPIALIIAMELQVMNREEPTYVRFYCWIKLLKIWSASRTDDLQGVIMRSLKLTNAGLGGIFWRTKVSGPGKRNRYLPFISRVLHGWRQGMRFWEGTTTIQEIIWCPLILKAWRSWTRQVGALPHMRTSWETMWSRKPAPEANGTFGFGKMVWLSRTHAPFFVREN